MIEKYIPPKTFYLTKYCLSKGIQTVSALCKQEGDVLISYHKVKIFRSKAIEYVPYMWRHKPDWHETKEAAIEQAEKMRAKAIATCERKLSKLKQLKF
jgi:hypothetical protein